VHTGASRSARACVCVCVCVCVRARACVSEYGRRCTHILDSHTSHSFAIELLQRRKDDPANVQVETHANSVGRNQDVKACAGTTNTVEHWQEGVNASQAHFPFPTHLTRDR
jgi:hypothetical protein